MSAATLHKFVGRAGLLRTDNNLTFAVEVLDAREVWGRLDYRVEPVAGNGSAWVSAERVTLL
jgi:hypothetical protein